MTTISEIADVVEPITVAQAQAQLYLPDEPDEGLIEIYIKSAREWVETYTGRHMVAKTVTYTTEITDTKVIMLPTEIDCVEIVKVDNITKVAHIYGVRAVSLLASETGGVEVIYKLSPTTMIHAFKSAILLMVGHLYENRQIVDNKMTNIKALIDPYRIMNPM